MSAADQPSSTILLPVTPAAPGLARRFVAGSLSTDYADVVDDVVLLTSELVANAVLYGKEPIRLRLHHGPRRVRVEVWDGGRPFTLSPMGPWSSSEPSGRGLSLVNALASSWGSHSTGTALAGKSLWFDLVRDAPTAAVP